MSGAYGSTGSFQASGSVDTAIVGVYTIDYTKVDLAGNIHTSTRTIQIVPLPPDTTPPVVTLIGSSSMIVTQSGVYTELGASWTDNRDGSDYTFTGIYNDIGSFQLSGSVDTFSTGVYTIDYTKVDLGGNTHTVTRTITVLTLPPIAVQPIVVPPITG